MAIDIYFIYNNYILILINMHDNRIYYRINIKKSKDKTN